MAVAADIPQRSRIDDPAAIERKLALNTYNVDAVRAHIRIVDHQVCLQCERQQCVNCCPANLLRAGGRRRGHLFLRRVRRMRHVPHRLL